MRLVADVHKIFTLSVGDLFVFLQRKLAFANYTYVRGKKFLYAINESYHTIPILLVAHLDTVHPQPKEIYVKDGFVVCDEASGLGADDRAGVLCILNMIKKGYRPSVLFTDGEESGCIGAQEFADFAKAPDVNLMVEVDRAGSNHFAFYTNKLTDELTEYMQECTGLTGSPGSITDIAVLTSEYDIDSVNIACGYYNNHTLKERLNIQEFFEACRCVQNILDNPPQSKLEPCEEPYAHNYWKTSNRYVYDSFYDEWQDNADVLATITVDDVLAFCTKKEADRILALPKTAMEYMFVEGLTCLLSSQRQLQE